MLRRVIVGVLLLVAGLLAAVYGMWLAEPRTELGRYSWVAGFTTVVFAVRFLWVVLSRRGSRRSAGLRAASGQSSTRRAPDWFAFQIDDPEDFDGQGTGELTWSMRLAEPTERERAVLAALRQRAVGWPGEGVQSWSQRKEGGRALVAALRLATVSEPPPPGLPDILWATFWVENPRARSYPPTELLNIGIHLLDGEFRGGPMNHHVYELEDEAGSLALPAVALDRPDALGRVAAWFEACLRRPVQRCEWRYRGRTYAARYEFADTREGLVEAYAKAVAPPGQHQRLLDVGQYRGRGWVKTAGIGEPDVIRQVRTDGMSRPVPALPALGVWYQCPLEIRPNPSTSK